MRTRTARTDDLVHRRFSMKQRLLLKCYFLLLLLNCYFLTVVAGVVSFAAGVVAAVLAFFTFFVVFFVALFFDLAFVVAKAGVLTAPPRATSNAREAIVLRVEIGFIVTFRFNEMLKALVSNLSMTC